MNKELQKAYFAAGCFWGVEYYFQKLEGVVSTSVGYMGGETKNPTYAQVCAHETGHVEAIEVVFDAEKITYLELAKYFFEIHDPTQVDRQGPDVGEQYQSAIFYIDQNQRETAEKLIKILEEKGYKIATKLLPVDTFWPAEGYHQNYYAKNNGSPYCHIYQKKF
ncbi:MAG: peptide-methionine (S)-S-oxide reductase MsrA [bacterium]